MLRALSTSILPALIASLGTLPLPAAAAETPGPRVDRRIPSWVVPVAVDLSPDDGATTQEETLLADHQERAVSNGYDCFDRTITRIRTSSGVEQYGEYRLSFEPAFEKATIHRITIHRGDRVIDALASADLRLIHRENDLRARIFNGTVDAVYVIEADAALVHSSAGKSLDRRLPSPFVFDHVVTRLRLGERELWVDPTRSHEHGGWDTLEPLPFRWALVISAATTDLTSIPLPRPPKPELAVRETYHLDPQTTRTELDVVTDHRGSEARAMRRRLETRSLAEVGQHALNFYAQSNHDVSIHEPMVVNDDPQRNLVTTIETYDIGRFFEAGDRDLDVWAIRGELDVPFTRLRTTPLAIEFPRSVRHEIIVVDDDLYDIDDEHRTVSGPAFELEFWASYDHPRIHLRWDYRATSDHVAVERIDEHLQAIETAQEVAYYGLATLPPETDPTGVLVALVVLVGGGVFAAFVRRRRSGRRRRAFSAQGRFAAGESPDTAVVLTKAEDLASATRRLRCDCGGRFDLHEVTEATYGDGRLTVAVLRCLRCEAEEPRYFSIA